MNFSERPCFCSSFRDWPGNVSNFPREITEKALAHVTGDKGRASLPYLRSALTLRGVSSVRCLAATVHTAPALPRPFADCGGDFERLAARILEGFGLLRERRRLFISYRRAEASGVAAQLYEALDAAGFDVFLDTRGTIRPGDQFQEILWHRLADTDVTVLLDTPDFSASRWTEEELARANTSNIQILQLLWPGQTEGATAAFSTFHPLAEDDFVGPDTLGPTAPLKDTEVNEIVDEVEGLRARAFGARHAFLVREFAIEARKEGLQVLTTLERNLILLGPDRSRTLVMPAIGVPDAERYETLGRLHQRDVDEGKSYARPPILLYDQSGIRDKLPNPFPLKLITPSK
jgi:hypothetical protein